MAECRPKKYPKLKDYKPSRFMLPTCHYDAAKADRAVTFIENLRHTKGKWAGRNHATVDAADHKSLCIVGSLFVVEFLDNLFVTGKFNISTQQHIGKPHQRIKPMDCQ